MNKRRSSTTNQKSKNDVPNYMKPSISTEAKVGHKVIKGTHNLLDSNRDRIRDRSRDEEYRCDTAYRDNIKQRSINEGDLRKLRPCERNNSFNQQRFSLPSIDLVADDHKQRKLSHGYNDNRRSIEININIFDTSNIDGGNNPKSKDVIGVKSNIDKLRRTSSKGKHRISSHDGIISSHTVPKDIHDRYTGELPDQAILNMHKEPHKCRHSYDEIIKKIESIRKSYSNNTARQSRSSRNTSRKLSDDTVNKDVIVVTREMPNKVFSSPRSAHNNIYGTRDRSNDKECRCTAVSNDNYKHRSIAEGDTRKLLQKSNDYYFRNVPNDNNSRDQYDLRSSDNQPSPDRCATKVIADDSKHRNISPRFDDKPTSRDIIEVNSIINTPRRKSSKDKSRMSLDNKSKTENISNDRIQSSHYETKERKHRYNDGLHGRVLMNMSKDDNKGRHSFNENVNDRRRNADKFDLGLIASHNAHMDVNYKKEQLSHLDSINTSKPLRSSRKTPRKSADNKLNKDENIVSSLMSNNVFPSPRNAYDSQFKMAGAHTLLDNDRDGIMDRSTDKEFRCSKESGANFKPRSINEGDMRKLRLESNNDSIGNYQRNNVSTNQVDDVDILCPYHLNKTVNQPSVVLWASQDSKQRSISPKYNDNHRCVEVNTQIYDASNINGGDKPTSRDIIAVNSIIDKPGGESSKDKSRISSGNKLSHRVLSSLNDPNERKHQSNDKLQDQGILNKSKYHKGRHSYDEKINDRHREADEPDLVCISSEDIICAKESINHSNSINISKQLRSSRNTPRVSEDNKLNKDTSTTNEVENFYQLISTYKAQKDEFKANLSRNDILIDYSGMTFVRDKEIKAEVPRTNTLLSVQPIVKSESRDYFSPSLHLDNKRRDVSFPKYCLLGDIKSNKENDTVDGGNAEYLLDNEIKDEFEVNKQCNSIRGSENNFHYFMRTDDINKAKIPKIGTSRSNQPTINSETHNNHNVGLFPGKDEFPRKSIITNIRRHSGLNSTFSKHMERDKVSSGNIHDTQEQNPSLNKPQLWEDNKNHLGDYRHVDPKVTMAGSANQIVSNHKNSVDKSRVLFEGKSNIKEYRNDGGKTTTDKRSHHREPHSNVLQNDIKDQNVLALTKSTNNSLVPDTNDHGEIPSDEKGRMNFTLDRSPRDLGLNITTIVPKQWENIRPVSEDELRRYRDNDLSLKMDKNPKMDKDAILSPRFKVIEEYRRAVPVSLENPRGFSLFNSVIQVLRCCLDFNYEMIKYHKQSLIIQCNSAATDNDKSFLIRFCKLLFEMSEGKQYDATLNYVHQYFQQLSHGNCVQKVLMLVFTTLKNVTQANASIKTEASDNAENAFLNFRNKNKGFMFDLFYGQMSRSIVCKICHYHINVSYIMFNILSIPIFTNETDTTLSKCIKSFFDKRHIELDEKMDCKCLEGSQQFYSQSKITHSPKYLFIYLTRKVKNEVFVTFDESMYITVGNGEVYYRLISVIDHIGDNEGGHYYCRCNYEGEAWWFINDTSIEKLGRDFEKVRSRQAIGFMYMKCHSRLDKKRRSFTIYLFKFV